MALDLYIQKDASLPESFDNCFLQIEDDGYYYFLQPFFEDLEKKTNQIIDIPEDAFFDGEDLDLLRQSIQKAKLHLADKPDSWEEFIGTTISSGERKKPEKIYSTVHKKILEKMLIKLEKAISKAKKEGLGIFFFGD